MEFNRPKINYSGPEWSGLKEWMENELLHTYKRLAMPTLSMTETQQLRGRASLLTQMLDFQELPAAFKPQNN